ncbi:MAG: Holliday junction resolvase RuvX [Chlamydiales bacterium]|nr:Holliday junction resolvase RuvX [Chlamydiales bacterium]
MRIAAIDYGEKRIGIALSDSNCRIALPLTTVEGGRNAVSNVLKALESYKGQIRLIVIGLPLLMNGTEGTMAQNVRAFAKKLESTSQLPLVFLDERLSSAQADRQLQEISMNRKARSSKIDMTAATLLLQHYLDSP